jgi:pyrroline-5-carboxylate reductase
VKKIGFLGAGNMGGAIIKGIANKLKDVEINVYDLDAEKASALNKYNVSILKCESDILNSSKYVFLAVKPQNLPELLPKISEFINEDTVIISICAGISGEYIIKHIGKPAKIVLAMPNTPLLLGKGATALSRPSGARLTGVTDEEFGFVKEIFDCSGLSVEIPPDRMKEIICINSSSPAFIYLFAKPFMDFCKNNGISDDAAKLLFTQTLIGAADMIGNSGIGIDELIKMVSSPGGTTIAGLSALYDGNLTDTVYEALKRCTKRAHELGGD